MATQTERERIGDQEYFERPRSEMLAFVPGDAARILEIGCGKGSFAKLIKARQQAQQYFDAFGPGAIVAGDDTPFSEIEIG